MDPDRWDRVVSIFSSAIDCDSEDRAALLDQSCGDDAELRAAVEQLIENDVKAQRADFLEPARVNLMGRHQGDDPLIGKQVGRYNISRLVGEGGMSRIYLAIRTTEYTQEVALKVLKRGMDTDAVLRRFRMERQMLADLKHPNIAHLMDGGDTEHGVPYFVMEYIEGNWLTEHCDNQRLGVEERLRLFLKVCAAVQFAHNRAVIHRDLKPSNILVETDGEPKLVDFGIAKLLDPKLHTSGSPTPETRTGYATPEYASPEQVRGDSVTTASDVYSLGMVLYELLTGSRAYALPMSNWDEMNRIVAECEPLPPSIAVSSERSRNGNGDREPRSLEEICTRRNSHPQQLKHTLAGDLDQILLMALRKDPQRRYESVEQFADDIRCFLAGRPVRAQADTLLYRSGKFVRRHKSGVAVSLLLLFALFAGVTGTTLAMLDARAQRKRAEHNFQLAWDAVDQSLTQVANDPRLEHQGLQALRHDLLMTVREFYEEFTKRNSRNPDLKHKQGRAFAQLAMITARVESNEDAIQFYRDAIMVFEQLAREYPGEAKHRDALASVHANLALSYANLGQFTQAKAANKKALELFQELARNRDRPRFEETIATVQNNLGTLYSRLGRHSDAQMAFKSAIAAFEALARQDPGKPRFLNELAKAKNNLAGSLRRVGKSQQAVALLTSARDLRVRLVKDNPEVPDYQAGLGASHFTVAGTHLGVGNYPEAEKAFRAAVAIQEPLVARHPTVSRYKQDLAMTYDQLAAVLLQTNRHSEALEEMRKAIRLQEPLAQERPGELDLQVKLATSQLNLGSLYSRQGILDKAKEQFTAALAGLEQCDRQSPGIPRYQRYIGMCHHNLGVLYCKSSRPSEAEESLTKALSIRKRLVAEYSSDLDYRVDVAYTRRQLAQLALDGSDQDQAFDHFKKATAELDHALQQQPNHPEAQQLLKTLRSEISQLAKPN